jgi:molecular chaperone GrpE
MRRTRDIHRFHPMNDETKRPDEAPEVVSAETANENDPIAALEQQVAELRDRYLRAAAEVENVRKRAEREAADARAYGIAGFAREVLSIADHLSRALEAVGPEARAAADGSLKGLVEGVELTERELQKALAQHGVRRIDPKGEKFDPNFHQAMLEVTDESVPPGTVAQVIQPGYAIGERILRPALVGVAKGGPKAATDDGGK